MTKADIVARIAEGAELTKRDATKALEAFLACVTESLVAGEKVTLTGFGTFSVAERAARTGKNPQSGAAMTIEARKAPKFKPGQALKDAVDK